MYLFYGAYCPGEQSKLFQGKGFSPPSAVDPAAIQGLSQGRTTYRVTVGSALCRAGASRLPR